MVFRKDLRQIFGQAVILLGRVAGQPLYPPGVHGEVGAHRLLVDDHPAQPKTGAQFDPALHRAGKMDEGGPGDVPVGRPAVGTDGRHRLGVEALHIESKGLRGAEGDAQGRGALPHVLQHEIAGVPIALPPAQRWVQAALPVVRTDPGQIMVVGVPDLIAQALQSMPGEPPLEHLRSHAGHSGQGSDVSAAVRHNAPAHLPGQVAGVQQVVPLLDGQGQRGVHGPGHLLQNIFGHGGIWFIKIFGVGLAPLRLGKGLSHGMTSERWIFCWGNFGCKHTIPQAGRKVKYPLFMAVITFPHGPAPVRTPRTAPPQYFGPLRHG